MSRRLLHRMLAPLLVILTIQRCFAATLLQDTFTDTLGTNLNAHTMNTGSGWTILAGTWLIGTNNVSATSTTANAEASADASNANVVITLDVAIPAGTVTYATGATGRVADASNGWVFIIESDNVGSDALSYIAIYERNAGTNTTRASVTGISGLHGTTQTITATLNGTSLTMDVQPINKTCNYTSSFQQTTTKHGIYNYTAASYVTGILDNFLVTGSSGATPCHHSLTMLGAGC